jgi:hypothetical protein
MPAAGLVGLWTIGNIDDIETTAGGDPYQRAPTCHRCTPHLLRRCPTGLRSLTFPNRPAHHPCVAALQSNEVYPTPSAAALFDRLQRGVGQALSVSPRKHEHWP